MFGAKQQVPGKGNRWEPLLRSGTGNVPCQIVADFNESIDRLRKNPALSFPSKK
jgi:hypothetical protein